MPVHPALDGAAHGPPLPLFALIPSPFAQLARHSAASYFHNRQGRCYLAFLLSSLGRG